MRVHSLVSGLVLAAWLSLTGWYALAQTGENKRLPLPDEVAQAKAMKLVQDIFQEDLAGAKEPEAKAKLAAYLLQQGRESKEDAANRFVLFREARDLAARAGDAPLALLAVDELTRDYDLPSLETKAGTLAVVVEANINPEAGKNLVEIIMPLIHEAVEADNYDTALALGKVAESAARKAKVLALVTGVQKRIEEVQTVQKGFARLQVYVDRLKNNPQDTEANLEMGKYYALLKGRWEKALPLLAMGSDETLKNLAREDLTQPKDPHKQLALADNWWDLAAQEKDPAQTSLQRRAMYWYEQAVGQLSGLNRTKALKRIDLVSARLAGTAVEAPVGPVGEIKKFEGHTEEVKSVSFSLDGRQAVSGGVDQTVRIWDLIAGKDNKVIRGHNKQVWSVAFHPNNRQVFSSSWDASARQWDIKTGMEVRRFSHRLDVNGMCLARDGNSLLTGSDDQHAYLWNVSTGDIIHRFTGHTGFVYSVAFAPDGRHGASGSVDRTVRVFELSTGSVVKVLEGQTSPVTNMVFSPDSRQIFSCGDGAVHQWDIATGKELRRFEGHTGHIPCLALSGDGRRLYTGGDDKTIRIWDVQAGKELHRFTGHTDPVTCLSLSSDGRRLLSGSQDRTVRLWGLPR